MFGFLSRLSLSRQIGVVSGIALIGLVLIGVTLKLGRAAHEDYRAAADRLANRLTLMTGLMSNVDAARLADRDYRLRHDSSAQAAFSAAIAAAITEMERLSSPPWPAGESDVRAARAAIENYAAAFARLGAGDTGAEMEALVGGHLLPRLARLQDRLYSAARREAGENAAA
ncbi:MAG: hypothetical protein K2Q10_00495, partial [Rhodospirillales bacterium]|nr:hypothetical protein [Rhodospirillales bacterium]